MNRFADYSEHVIDVWRNGTYIPCPSCGAPRKGGDSPPRGWAMSIVYTDPPYEFTPHLGNCAKVRRSR